MGALSYLVGALGFAVYAILFMVLLRLHLSTGWFLLELGLGLAVHVLSSFLGVVWISGFVYWYNLALYAFLWFCFFFVSSIYSVSVTVGIINHLFGRPDNSAPMAEIYEICIVTPFKERADFLVQTGQALLTDQGYISTPEGRKNVELMQLVNNILGMESYAFYHQSEQVPGDTANK